MKLTWKSSGRHLPRAHLRTQGNPFIRKDFRSRKQCHFFGYRLRNLLLEKETCTTFVRKHMHGIEVSEKPTHRNLSSVVRCATVFFTCQYLDAADIYYIVDLIRDCFERRSQPQTDTVVSTLFFLNHSLSGGREVEGFLMRNLFIYASSFLPLISPIVTIAFRPPSSDQI